LRIQGSPGLCRETLFQKEEGEKIEGGGKGREDGKRREEGEEEQERKKIIPNRKDQLQHFNIFPSDQLQHFNFFFLGVKLILQYSGLANFIPNSCKWRLCTFHLPLM
jgi:hypothetical protein